MDQAFLNKNALLLQVKKGNEEAFRTLFDGYRDRLYFYTLQITSSRELAEDIVQDTFLKIWLRRDQLDEIENFGAYIFRMAANAVYSGLRRKAKELAMLADSSQGPIDDSQPEKELQFKFVREVIQQTIADLPEQQKRVYVLRREEGLRPGEIARQMDITETTVKRHLTLAQKTLRKALEEFFPHSAGILLIILGLH